MLKPFGRFDSGWFGLSSGRRNGLPLSSMALFLILHASYTTAPHPQHPPCCKMTEAICGTAPVHPQGPVNSSRYAADKRPLPSSLYNYMATSPTSVHVERYSAVCGPLTDAMGSVSSQRKLTAHQSACLPVCPPRASTTHLPFVCVCVCVPAASIHSQILKHPSSFQITPSTHLTGCPLTLTHGGLERGQQ